jgi:predicted ATP-dependent serine protease
VTAMEDITTETIGTIKVPTGICGFDSISKGGLPAGRTTLVVGTPGSGKTVFALQTLVNGAREFGEPGIFVAFEESSAQIVANAKRIVFDGIDMRRHRGPSCSSWPTAWSCCTTASWTGSPFAARAS